MITTAGISAQKDHVNLDGTKVFAEKHMSAGPPRRIVRIVVRIDVAAGVPAEYRPKFERICQTCPVNLSIHPEIKVDLNFQYPD